MTYKDFTSWCNERACDGMWGFREALVCADVMNRVRAKLPWRREREWGKINSDEKIEKLIVKPTNDLIKSRKSQMEKEVSNSDYISKSALLRQLDSDNSIPHARHLIKLYVEEAPTLDLVQSVTCGKCGYKEEHRDFYYCRYLHAYVPKDFGCISGKPKQTTEREQSLINSHESEADNYAGVRSESDRSE